jgi:hypothetical protein
VCGGTDENENSFWVGVALDLVEPEVEDAVEALLVGDVVDEEDGMCACVGGEVLL